MPDISAAAPSLALGLLVVFMLWFAFGTQYNIRRGNAVLRWLQGGLPMLGPRTTLRWLGSSVLELSLVDPTPPFREAQVLVLLEPRDVSLLWAFARARGRRDFMIIRGNLQRAPQQQFEAAAGDGWTAAAGRERIEERLGAGSEWRRADWDGTGSGRVEAAVGPRVEPGVARRAWEDLERSGASLWRISVQQTVPHLEVHLLPPPSSAKPDALIAAVRRLALDSAQEG